jgi:hypothetical protein
MEGPQTPGQNLDAAHLVDEIDGPRLEREVFLGFESITGEKHDGQVHANLTQFNEQSMPDICGRSQSRRMMSASGETASPSARDMASAKPWTTNP